MIKLKKIYQKTSKQTQNKLQEIFNSIDFDFNNLYSIADNKSKKRIDTYIDEWEDKGLLTGNFETLARNIKNRTRVKNSEILELLIYGAYIEEQNKLKEPELNTFKEVANYYYQEGQKEVNKTLSKKKIVSVIPDAIFLALMSMPNSKGYIWNEYIETMMKYNADQIYRQATIDLQQQKQLDITNDIYQNLIKRQQSSKLNINEDKISGDVDLTLIGINNQAKIKGIYSFDEKAKCKFVSVEDEATTKMCRSLDGQEFYIHDWNEFERYSKSNDSIRKYKCYGLVSGLNLPPINDGFHWCRSTIIYQIIDNNFVELEQNKNYDLFDNIYENEIKKHNINRLNIKHIDKKALKDILSNMEKVHKDFPQIKNKIKQIKEVKVSSRAGISIEPQTDGTYIMEININAFRDKNIAKKMYANDVKTNYHPKNGTYKDMGIHEAGHMVLNEILKKKYINQNALVTDWNNNITSQKIVSQAFNNLKISGIMQKRKALKEISMHAVKFNSNETIAEAFVDYYTNKNKATRLSKEIIDIMKGMI